METSGMGFTALLVVFQLFMCFAIAQKPHVTCDKKYKKVGCFAQNKSFKMLFSDRMLNWELNKGHLIDWKNWNEYIHSFACRCNELAIANGFDYFALRYFGECFGAATVSPSGSTACLSHGYEPCIDSTDKECVGVSLVDYIYEVGRDGGLSNWKNATSCSKTCGTGRQTRERTCTNPTPSGYGKDCTGLGSLTEILPCNLEPCKIDGRFSSWSGFGSCSKTCGGGIQTRRRQCNNPAPVNGGKNCEGAFNESRSCNNELCPGAAGISMAQEIVENYLLGFFNSTYPTKTPSGKFRLAIFAIQRAVANEMAFGTVKENLQQRLQDLRKFLKVATEGGSIEFARSTLGKSLFVFMKKKIKEGLPYNGISIAVNDFLNSIKKDIGDKKFDDLMLIDGGATLIFTVDTTGSMKDEIDAARGIASSIITMPRKFPVDYVLSPFNDPGYGPVVYKNESNKNEFITAIRSLPVTGGRDCPELSFTGMLEAFKANPRSGSPMFVFTDASAKDDTPANIERLKVEAAQYDSTINFFTNQAPCGDTKGIQSYKDIASFTSGQIFPLKNHGEISSFTKYIKTSLRPSVTVAKGHVTPTFGRKRRSATNTHKLYVEAGVDVLQVTIEVMAKASTRSIVLEDPTSNAASADAKTTYTKVYNIDKPAPGEWKLTVPIYAGEYSFIAKVFSESTVDFATYFLHQEREGGPLVSLANPLSGPKSRLVVQVSEIDLVDQNSLRIGLTDEAGGVLQDGIIPSKTGGTAGILQASVSTPRGKFKVLLSGTTKGHKFQRLSRTGFEATDLALVSIKGGEEYTASVGKGRSEIKMYVYNGGNSDTFTLSSSTSLGYVSINIVDIRLDKGQNATVTVNLQPPKSSASVVGKLATIVLTATGKNSAKRFQSEVKMLWVP